MPYPGGKPIDDLSQGGTTVCTISNFSRGGQSL
ncbi:MAG: hypothetical protein V8T45_12715 [Oscillospiraceae bacterium]